MRYLLIKSRPKQDFNRENNISVDKNMVKNSKQLF